MRLWPSDADRKQQRQPCIDQKRKTNSSPAQPLLEDAASFGFNLEEASVLVRLHLALESNKEKIYEISVFPKNAALAFRR